MNEPIEYTIKQAQEGLARLSDQHFRSWEGGAALKGLEAIKRLQARIVELEATQFPEQLTPDLREVLGMMIMQTCPIAHGFQAAGYDIPKKTEAEQAFVLHWLVGLALKHGEAWRKAAADELSAIANKVQDARKAQS
jgi:hypothetical protein